LIVREDLTGKRFGRLLVLNQTEPKRYKTGNHSRWLCLCDCGNTPTIFGNSLRRADTKSCGCLKIETNQRNPGQSGLSDVYSNYKKNARIRNLEFSITKLEFSEISKKNCYYCGGQPSNTNIVHYDRPKQSQDHEKYIYNGLDRIDNNLGYILSNIVPCCKKCNFMKWNLNSDEFITHIRKISYHNEVKLYVPTNALK